MAKITDDDVAKIISAIKMQYPNAVNYQNEQQLDLLIEIWLDCLKEYPAEVVWQATKEAFKTVKYVNQGWLAEIVEKAEAILSIGQKSETELWAELTAVLYEVNDCAELARYDGHREKSAKRIKEIYDGLSPEIQAYVPNANTLIEIASLDDEQLQYEKGRFMKTVPNLRQRIKYKDEYQKLAEPNPLLQIDVKGVDDDSN